MSNKEREELNKAIKEYGREVSTNKEASKQLLINIGVMTEKGNIRKPYKRLCTVLGQD